MMFGRNRDKAPTPHPKDCGVQTLQVTSEERESVKTEMVMDTSSEAYQKARRLDDKSDADTFYDSLETLYAKQGGQYVPHEVAKKSTVYIGTITCRRMENQGLEPVTGSEQSTPQAAAANVGKTVADLYCRTCPYVGKDLLGAAQYDAEVARAEREAADLLLAAEQARREVTEIHQRFDLNPPHMLEG